MDHGWSKEGMITLPIPLFVAFVLGFLLLRHWMQMGRLMPLGWLLVICAVQSLIIALSQHYNVPLARPAQALGACLIPGVAWLAFLGATTRVLRWRDGVHLLWPLVALLAIALQPAVLDALIPLLFLGYGSAILLRCWGGVNDLPQLRLDGGQMPLIVWRVIAISLTISALSDVLIVVSQVLGAEWLKPLLISGYSAANLLIIGSLSLTDALKTEAVETPDPKPTPTNPEQDGAAVATLITLMERERLYLDPDLTLAKMARKTGIPAKTLSGAINRVTGHSVSRFVNNLRIGHAQDRLRRGDRVTTAMLEAGFNTKSNFHREFLRVAGQSPTDWLKSLG